MDANDLRALDDLIQRVGVSQVLEIVADHVLFQSGRMRRRRDQVKTQDAKGRYRLISRKTERAARKLSELAADLKSVENIK